MNALKFTLLLILIILIGFPITLLLISSFKGKEGLSWENYTLAFSRKSNIRSLVRTIYLSIFTSLLSGLIGSVLAWLVVRTNVPGRNILRTILIIPYMVPPFIGAMGWMFLFGKAGYINKMWERLFGRDLYNIHSFSGIVLVLSMYLYPLVFLNVASSLESMDPSLEEAGRICGAGIGRIMRTISLPLVFPSIMSGMLLVFAASSANFGVPAIIGMPGRIYVLTTKIMSYIYSGTSSGLRKAVALSVALIGIALLGLLLNNFLISRTRFTIITGKHVKPSLINLGRFRPLVGSIIWIFTFFAVFLPIFSVVLTSFWKAWGLPFKLSSFTFENFEYVLFKFQETRTAFVNSTLFAIVSATLTTFIGALVAYSSKKMKDIFTRFMDFLATIPQAIPGTVVAISMILAWSGKFGLNLYNTAWIIIIAYVARYLFFSVRTVSGSLVQIHDSLEEAGRSAGASQLRVAKDITFPLIKAGLLASWAMIFMPTFRELTISILLYGPATRTIGVAIFELQDAGEYQSASAMATIVLIVTFTMQFVVNTFFKRKREVERNG